MSGDSSGRDETQTTEATESYRLAYLKPVRCLKRNETHVPENYEDLKLEFPPEFYSELERYLPSKMLTATRDVKLAIMKGIVDRRWDRIRARKYKEYRQYIRLHYKPLKKEIYVMDRNTFFVPSFIKAITENTEESLTSIISEPSPGVYTFAMLQPSFCASLSSEVKSFKKWAQQAKFKIMPPNTWNKFGAVLDDFGLETMLDSLMNEYISPISRVFFPEVGGTSLDSHHGFVVEYGENWDKESGLHVDDSEVTLNVCLGMEFSGGELFFKGVRCDKHVKTGTQEEEAFDYSHTVGHGVLHRGRHRHGARFTTAGHRTNLLLWCRSSVFRASMKPQGDFPGWCRICQLQKKERQRQSVDAAKKIV